MELYISTKKSQVWGIDLIIALTIFLIGIILFYMYSINYPTEAEENIDKLIYDGKIIADSILSEGYPENWDSENVVRIGITNNGKINETKLEKFYDLTNDNYEKTKALFNTRYDYYFFLSEDMIIHEDAVEGIGKSETDPENIPAQNLIKTTRFTIYKEKPITAYLYVWE